LGHARPSGLPQLAQNRAPSGFSAPQFGHVCISASVSAAGAVSAAGRRETIP
jgi:hypothetical protein